MSEYTLDTVVEVINGEPMSVHKVIERGTGRVAAECLDPDLAVKALLDLNGVDVDSLEWDNAE
jgi:hypothetical protein